MKTRTLALFLLIFAGCEVGSHDMKAEAQELEPEQTETPGADVEEEGLIPFVDDKTREARWLAAIESQTRDEAFETQGAEEIETRWIGVSVVTLRCSLEACYLEVRHDSGETKSGFKPERLGWGYETYTNPYNDELKTVAVLARGDRTLPEIDQRPASE